MFPVLAYYVLQQPPVYQARSLILFALGREYVYVPDAAGTGVKAPNPGDFQGVVNAEMLLLDNPKLSRSALETVGVQKVYPGLPNGEAALQQAVLRLQDATTVELITGSYVVKVAVRHRDPEIAAALANALTRTFLESRQQLYNTRETRRLETRLAAVTTQAGEVNAEISRLLDGLDPAFIEADFETTSEDQANLSRLLRESRTSLAALEARRSVFANRFGMEDEVLAAETEIREEQARLDYIERSMVENRERVLKLSQVMPVLRPLIELQKQQEDQIASLKLQLRDSRALSGTDAEGNVRVIEEAVPPLQPSSPPREVQLAILALVSLLAGMCVAGLGALRRRPETAAPPSAPQAAPAPGQPGQSGQPGQPAQPGRKEQTFRRLTGGGRL